jgi:hypothetical protein
MGFCYSRETFLPYDCSFPIYYFIISLQSLSSLSPFSFPFLCQNKKDWTDLQISLETVIGSVDQWIGGSLEM